LKENTIILAHFNWSQHSTNGKYKREYLGNINIASHVVPHDEKRGLRIIQITPKPTL